MQDRRWTRTCPWWAEEWLAGQGHAELCPHRGGQLQPFVALRELGPDITNFPSNLMDANGVFTMESWKESDLELKSSGDEAQRLDF